MHAAEVMTKDVITVGPKAEVKEIVDLMIKNRISAIPVVDDNQHVLGIVSEGDLMRRVENETDKRESWWLKSLFSGRSDADSYIKSHARRAEDLMTAKPFTVTEDMPLYKIAQTLEEHHIKRVPVVRDKKLVGIVSRSNLLQGFSVAAPDEEAAGTADDHTLREKVMRELNNNAGVSSNAINVVVCDGIVSLFGLVTDAKEQKAAKVAAESVSGVKEVKNYLNIGHAVLGGAGPFGTPY